MPLPLGSALIGYSQELVWLSISTIAGRMFCLFFILTGINYPYYPQPLKDSVQSLSRFQWHFFPELGKTMLKFIFPQAISLPMICPLLEQADFRGSFTAMCLKISGIEIEFESPHGMAGSGENWKGTPMIGWVIPDLRHPSGQIWSPHSSSRPSAGRVQSSIFEDGEPFLDLARSPWVIGRTQLSAQLLVISSLEIISRKEVEPDWLGKELLDSQLTWLLRNSD